LRCLALATIDEPQSRDSMNLTDCTRFAQYEVSAGDNSFIHSVILDISHTLGYGEKTLYVYLRMLYTLILAYFST